MKIRGIVVVLIGLFALVCCNHFFRLVSFRPCIGILSDNQYCGERELAWRVKRAAENLGWKVIFDEERGRFLKRKRGVDWVFCIAPQQKRFNKYSKNYVALFHPFAYEEPEIKRVPFYERYDGYLLTINPEEGFKTFLETKNKQLFSVPFYPSLQYFEYMQVPLNHVMTMIPVWGNRIKDEKYKRIYSLLSQGGFTKFYGINDTSEVAKEHYMGQVPFDGVSVVNAIQKHGISLIFHSDIHNREEIPSGRIFEAAAASAVIICDTNAFVKRNFGETVFYIDTSLSAEEIFQQIKNHVDDIHLNPEKALAMAKKAHDIFVDRFLMETQLLNVMSMHKEIIKHEKNVSLRLPFINPLPF